MSNFLNPFYRALDSNGDPISGALLYFYEAGTSTPKNTFSDEALSSANANPVVADSNGYFGRIYMAVDTEYKAVLKDSGGNTIWTADNLDPSYITAPDVSTRIAQISSNPIDQGAAGDGVTDDATELQAAIDAATGTVDLLGKTYRCDSTLQLKTGLRLINGTLDFSNSADGRLVSIEGTSGSSSTTVSSATDGDASVTGAVAGSFAAGDYVRLSGGSALFDNSDDVLAMYRLTDVSSTTFTTDRPIWHDVTSGTITRFPNAIDRVVLRDLTIKGATSNAADSLYATGASNLTVENCKFEAPSDAAIHLTNTFGAVIRNCEIVDADDTTTVAVELDAAHDVRIENCSFADVYTGVQAGSSLGASSGVVVSGCFVHAENYGIHFDSLSHDCSAKGCEVYIPNTTGSGVVVETAASIVGVDVDGGDIGFDIFRNESHEELSDLITLRGCSSVNANTESISNSAVSGQSTYGVTVQDFYGDSAVDLDANCRIQNSTFSKLVMTLSASNAFSSIYQEVMSCIATGTDGIDGLSLQYAGSDVFDYRSIVLGNSVESGTIDIGISNTSSKHHHIVSGNSVVCTTNLGGPAIEVGGSSSNTLIHIANNLVRHDGNNSIDVAITAGSGSAVSIIGNHVIVNGGTTASIGLTGTTTNEINDGNVIGGGGAIGAGFSVAGDIHTY